jgi:hypothetical protein
MTQRRRASASEHRSGATERREVRSEERSERRAEPNVTHPERPRFYGIRTYQDAKGRFSFRYPSTWHQFELDDDRDGVMFSPEPDNPATFFAVWVAELHDHVVAEDADDLRAGVDDGLAGLPGCEIEVAKDDLLSNLVKFERIYTFREGDAVRKRRVWIMYVDTWQMVVVFQGASPEEYHYWLPMGNYGFAMFNIPEDLWFATDRDLEPYRFQQAT